jgi:hypothetical protein
MLWGNLNNRSGAEVIDKSDVGRPADVDGGGRAMP